MRSLQRVGWRRGHQVGPTEPFEVHGQEGDVGEDIVEAESVVELQAVQDAGAVVSAEDVVGQEAAVPVQPRVRLPGAGGAPEIATSCREVIVVLRQNRRAFVETVDFVTSAGHLSGGEQRAGLGFPGRGPVLVVTDLGLLTPDPETKELVLTSVHQFGALRALQARTEAARTRQG